MPRKGPAEFRFCGYAVAQRGTSAGVSGCSKASRCAAPGTAAFFTTDPNAVSPAFASNLEHNAVVHERVLFITVQNRDVPFVAPDRGLLVTSIGPNCYRIQLSYRFKDKVDLPLSLEGCVAGERPSILPASRIFSATRVSSRRPGTGMWLWRERFFLQ